MKADIWYSVVQEWTPINAQQQHYPQGTSTIAGIALSGPVLGVSNGISSSYMSYPASAPVVDEVSLSLIGSVYGSAKSGKTVLKCKDIGCSHMVFGRRIDLKRHYDG